MANATVTARLDTDTKKLGLCAQSTPRSRSFLIAEAVRIYVKKQAGQMHGPQMSLGMKWVKRERESYPKPPAILTADKV